MITLGTGRTTVLQGIVHLVIFAVFLFFAVVPYSNDQLERGSEGIFVVVGVPEN